MARLEEILVLLVLTVSFIRTKCSQDSHGSYSHYLDKKSYIYRSAIGIPNTGTTEGTEENVTQLNQPQQRSLVPEPSELPEARETRERGFKSYNNNITKFVANLYSSPYSAYNPYQQQIYKRNAFSSPDLNGPPAPIGIPPGFQHSYNYGGHTNPYLQSYPTYRSSPYVTNIHYPPAPVYISPNTSPAPIYRYSPTPVPYTTPVPAYRFSPTSHGISPTPPLTHHTSIS